MSSQILLTKEAEVVCEWCGEEVEITSITITRSGMVMCTEHLIKGEVVEV